LWGVSKGFWVLLVVWAPFEAGGLGVSPWSPWRGREGESPLAQR